MIDLHTHILPNIDDGPDSVEEAVKMTEVLYKQDIQSAVCTPHFNPSHCSLEKFIIMRAAAVKQMEQSRITLLSASETILHEYLFYYSDLTQLCIEKTRYLLLELPFQSKWNNKNYELLNKLINYYDVIPVIAHIERYCKRKKQEKDIRRLKEKGCIIQLNTSTIINRKSRHMALCYIKQGYIDVLGSDCHNMTVRPPIFAEARRIITNKLGMDYYDQLEYKAESIVRGDPLHKMMIYSL
jgi:protein-tyrosine phosphatase